MNSTETVQIDLISIETELEYQKLVLEYILDKANVSENKRQAFYDEAHMKVQLKYGLSDNEPKH